MAQAQATLDRRPEPGVHGSARVSAVKRGGARAVLYATATFFTLFAALPFAWMILTVFKTDPDLYFNVIKKNPFLYNEPPTLDNLRLLFQDTQYLTFVRNSLVVGILVVLVTLVISTPAAYALTRLAGRWGGGLGITIFLVYLVPPTLLFIPMTRIVADLNLKNSIW
jgi:multiple sugar transport system permease protein